MNLNKVILIGNLTRDPESKSLPSGTLVTTFSVATNRVWKDKNGQKQEDSQFHNIVVFGPQAETVARYLKRGQIAMVEGRLQTRSWDGPDGNKRYRTEIVAERVQFGPKTGSGQGPSPANSPKSKEPNEPPTVQYPEENINPEDIPF